MYGEDGLCECVSCQLARLTEFVAELTDRVSALEARGSLDIAGDVDEEGNVTWRDGEEMT